MPTTVNGVGTRYSGRKDASVVQGTCSSCKRFTTLSSYDTREWFCFVYIPIVPLRRFRILNECAVCRRHHRIPLAQFKEQLESEVAPLRAAVERNPLDPEPRVRWVQGLIGFQMYTAAENAAREGVVRLPREPRLNKLLADLLSLRGDAAGATPYYRQAAALAPDDAEIRFDLGRNLLKRGENAEAVRELSEAWRRNPGSSHALYLMGEALFAEKRWTEALDAYQQVVTRHPEMATDRDLLRQMKACKEALGFPLTDAERRAGRRWWPFGGSRRSSASQRPASAIDGRRIAILLGVVVLGGGLVALGMAFWKQRSVELWFDNGTGKVVRVTLDGEAFPLPPGPPDRKTVKPGSHAIVIADLQGRELERFTAQVPKLDLFDSLATDRLFVYNVGTAHIYQREEIGYANASANATYRASFIAFERFFEQRDVDYAFEPAPETIQVDSKSSITRKVALNVAQIDANRLGLYWFGEGKAKDAERAFRQALAAEPCSVPARRNLLEILPAGNAAVAEARKWMAECPGVEAHRSYQQARLALGQRAALLEEYRALLAAHPDAGANHYLYGRLLEDPDQAVPLYRRAAELDPQLAWSRLALAHSYLALERYGQALEALEPALRLPHVDPSAKQIYAMTAIGAGTLDRAQRALKGEAEGEESSSTWHARWLLRLAGGELEAAEKVLRERELALGEGEAEIWILRSQLLRAKGDTKALKRHLAEGRLRADVAELAGTLFEEAALAEGRWPEAAAAFDHLKPEEATFPDRILAAWALRMSGDAKGAEERLTGIEQALQEELDGDPDGDAPKAAYLAMSRHLLGRAPAEAVLSASRRAGFQLVALAYFILGAGREASGDLTGARSLYGKARSCSLDLGAPLYAAAARAREPGGSGSDALASPGPAR